MSLVADELSQWVLACNQAEALLDRAEAAEAERDRLRGLIDYAVMLHENGEAPPGHELATWDGWYRTVRAALAGDEA